VIVQHRITVVCPRLSTVGDRQQSWTYRQQSRPRQTVEFKLLPICCRFVAKTGNKVDRIGNKVDRIGNSRLCCRFVAGFGNSRLSTKSTVLNLTLSPVCTRLYISSSPKTHSFLVSRCKWFRPTCSVNHTRAKQRKTGKPVRRKHKRREIRPLFSEEWFTPAWLPLALLHISCPLHSLLASAARAGTLYTARGFLSMHAQSLATTHNDGIAEFVRPECWKQHLLPLSKRRYRTTHANDTVCWLNRLV